MGSSFKIYLGARDEGGDCFYLWLHILRVECECGGDFDFTVGGAVGFAGDFDAGGFEPAGVAFGGDLFAALGGVDAGGVFDRGKLVDAVGFVEDALVC